MHRDVRRLPTFSYIPGIRTETGIAYILPPVMLTIDWAAAELFCIRKEINIMTARSLSHDGLPSSVVHRILGFFIYRIVLDRPALLCLAAKLLIPTGPHRISMQEM